MLTMTEAMQFYYIVLLFDAAKGYLVMALYDHCFHTLGSSPGI